MPEIKQGFSGIQLNYYIKPYPIQTIKYLDWIEGQTKQQDWY